MADIIQKRRDIAANWTAVNPILAEGEEGYETDTKRIKIGDGSTQWTSLGYTGGGVSSIVGGTNVTIDNSDPSNPIVNASGGGGGGSLALNDLTDVDTYPPVNGDILYYNTNTWTKLSALAFARTDTTNIFSKPQLSSISVADSGIYDLNLTNKFTTTVNANITLDFTNIAGKDGMGGTIYFDNTSGQTISASSVVFVDDNFLSTVSTSGTFIIGFEIFNEQAYLTTSGVIYDNFR